MKKRVIGVLIGLAIALVFLAGRGLKRSPADSQSESANLYAKSALNRSVSKSSSRKKKDSERVARMVYQQFPELEPVPSTLPEGVSPDPFFELLDWFEKAYADKKEVPKDILKMANGSADFDLEKANAFLKEHEELMNRFLEMSEIDLQARQPIPLGHDSGDTMLDMSRYARCLSFLALSEAETDRTEATQIFKKQLSLAKHFRHGDILSHMIANNIESSALYHAGNATPEARLALSGADHIYGFQEAFRNEYLQFYNLLTEPIEDFRHASLDELNTFEKREKFERNKGFLPLPEYISSMGKEERASVTDARITEYQNLDWDEFHLVFATHHADHVEQSSKLKNFDNKLTETGYAEELREWYQSENSAREKSERASIIPALSATITDFNQSISSMVSQRRQLVLREALNAAHHEGHEVTSLQDLVPNFLETVPVHPEVGEDFIYDPASRTLKTSEKKQRYQTSLSSP